MSALTKPTIPNSTTLYIYISHSTPLKKKRTLSFGEGYIHYILPIHLQPTTTLFTHTHTYHKAGKKMLQLMKKFSHSVATFQGYTFSFQFETHTHTHFNFRNIYKKDSTYKA